jgi:hypothetical protein
MHIMSNQDRSAPAAHATINLLHRVKTLAVQQTPVRDYRTPMMHLDLAVLGSSPRGGSRRLPRSGPGLWADARCQPESGEVGVEEGDDLRHASVEQGEDVEANCPATSAAEKPSTSRWISAARCNADRRCNTAANASSTVSRAR